MASVSKHIKRLRAARHMTQEELAEKLFVTRQAVSAWETGKSLPDVETLERIAAALEADVMEVIYGAPQPSDLRPVKRRWAMIGAIFAIILSIIYILLVNFGVIGTWKDGFRYQFWSMDYSLDTRYALGKHSLELDLNDLESNAGKVLYEDDSGCRVTVKYVERDEENAEDYVVVFQADAAYTSAGGQLVTGSYDKMTYKGVYSSCSPAAMVTSVGGEMCVPSRYYTMSSIRKDGNSFGFHIFPIELYEDDGLIIADRLAASDDRVTVTVTGLVRLTTQRM